MHHSKFMLKIYAPSKWVIKINIIVTKELKKDIDRSKVAVGDFNNFTGYIDKLKTQEGSIIHKGRDKWIGPNIHI